MQDFLNNNLKLIIAFRRTLTAETDRGCVLMTGSYLENELEKLIRDKLVGTKKQLDDLFGFSGTIGSFSSKIKMCYALGLISEFVMSDLDIIRKIRNEFGHDYNPIDFESEHIKNRTLNLQNHFLDIKVDKPRNIFVNSTLGILAEIHGELINGKKIQKKENKDLSKTNKAAKESYQEISEIILKKTNMKKDEIEKLMFDELMNRIPK